MGDWCSEDVADTTILKNRAWEKRLEITAARGKIGSGDLCKEKKIAFLLEWGKIFLDKDLLMGDPFIFSFCAIFFVTFLVPPFLVLN